MCVCARACVCVCVCVCRGRGRGGNGDTVKNTRPQRGMGFIFTGAYLLTPSSLRGRHPTREPRDHDPMFVKCYKNSAGSASVILVSRSYCQAH